MSTYSTSQGPTKADGNTAWRIALAWLAVGMTPVMLTIGFVLGYALGLDPTIEDPLTGWDAAWRVIILWLVVVSASIAGMALGWAARRHGERSAIGAIVVNGVVFVVFTLMTLVGGLADAFG